MSEFLVARAFGYRLGFRWELPSGRAVVEGVLLPDWDLTQSDDADHWFSLDDKNCLYDGEAFWAQEEDPESLRHRLQQLVQMRLTAEATGFVFLHAGVVKWGAGALVIPGPSRAGKSTLVLELVRAGGAFLSDEFAVIDPQGLVHAYPRPLWQRLSKTRKRCWTLAELGWSPCGPLVVQSLLMTRYVAGVHWNPVHLELEQALDEIWKEVRYPSCRPGVRDWLRRAFEGARRLRGTRAEVAELLPGLTGNA